MGTDFNALVNKYKKKNKYGNSGTVTVQSSVKSKEEEEFEQLVEKYRQQDISSRITKSDLFAPTVRVDDDDDIAPVKNVQEEDDSLLDFFQKGSFEDGFDWHDIPTAILGTAGDAALGIVKGAAGIGEGLGDLVTYGIAGVADAAGKASYAEDMRKRASVNLVDKMTKGADDYLNQYSVLGRTSDSIAQGIGQVGSILLTGGLGAAAGLGAAGTTALTTGVMGLSGMGSGMGEAYQGGATDEEALKYGVAAGASDALWELLFGGMGKAINAVGFSKGLSSLDDIVAKGVTKAVSNPNVRNALEFAVKSGFEGLEEVGSGFTQAVAKKLTYMSEEEFGEILEDENLLEQFIVGAATSGITQSGSIPGTYNGSLKEANKTGKDFITGYTQNEQAVIQKEVEKRIAEQEKNGKKLTGKEKSDIEARVEAEMEKGYISTDTIEEVLGGDSFKAYQDTVKSEDDLVKQEKTLTEEYNKLNKMVNEKMTGEQQVRRDELRTFLPELRSKIEDQNKNSKRNALKAKLSEEVKNLVAGDRLAESYNERTRRTQAFQADLSQYDEKQQAVVKKAVESGILNNTNRAHDFVDMVAKLSAKTGVLFDFTNNAKLKESGFAMDGKTINGYATKDGIAVNIQSAKALNTVVGHEITHVLKGTELYSELQNAALEFAQSKGEYQSRYDSLLKMYENVEDADIYEELTADLVGDYLFTDEAFISNLSTEHRNVFQKVYDEIKYMLKVATAGSKEARELEKVKRAFDKAFREMGTKNTADSGAKYSLNEFAQDGRRYVEIDQEQSRFDGHSVEDYPRIAKDIINEKFNGKVIGIDNKMFVNGAGRDEFANPSKRIPDEYYEAKMRTAGELDNLLDAGANFRNAPDGADGHVHKDVTGGFDYFDTLFKIGDRYYEAVINIKNVKRGKLFKDVTKIKDVTQDIMNSYGENPKFQFLRTSSMDIVSTEGEKVNPKFSISDTTGRQLSKEQAEYFKDSKVRDESGNLKVMYHGTPNGDFTVFKDGTYFTDNKEYADRYQNPGASSISTGKTASNPKTFAVYLDIKKPFDLNDAEAKRIYIEDYIKGGNAMGINPYLSDAEYAKINTIDWTEGEDLRDFLTENGYDYDGLVLDEGADGGYGDEVQSRGTSYVVFSPEQVKNIENAQPTADPDIRFSLSEATDETTVKSYAEITEEQQSLYQREMRLRERKQEAVSNPELLQAMDDYAGLFTEMRSLLPKRRDGTATQAELDRIEEIKALREEKLQRVADLQESLGLNAIAKEEAEIRETKEALRVAADAAWAREGAEKENKAIEKAGVPAEEYFRKKALKAFKTTTNFNEAGYMLPDGKLLNFSGGERNHRYRDHREIGEIYEATQGAAALNRFMRDGNIRIMAESPGIDLTSVVEPTKEQYAALRKFINTNGVAEGQFFVDFSGAEGENVGKYAYNGKIMADRILNDIKYFFQTGKVRESSGLLDFLSLSAEGETNKSFGNYNVYGRDIELDAPVKETQLAAENSTPNSTDEDSSVAPVAISQTETTTEDLFPDDTAPVQEEYEFLLAEREDIVGAMDAFAAVGNYDGAEQLMAEYEAVQARIAEIEADDTDRLASLDEADAPPEVDNAPEDVADNVPLTKVLVTNLAKQVKAQLGLGNNRTAEVRELIERYSNEEFPSKAHLYTEIQDRFGKYTEAETDEDLVAIKSLLRRYPINVDESIKGEIADYGQLMRSNFGKVRFAKDGLPVDVAYKEFQEALPGYFPEDIYVPTDQLMRIIEVANMDTTTSKEYEIDWQTLEDVTDTIMNGVAEFKENRKEALANRHGRESFNSLMETPDQFVPPIAEDIAPVRPAIQNVQADPDDIAPVYDTSSGQQSLMPEEEAPKEITRAEQRRNKQESYTQMWENMIGDTSTWKDMPIGLQYKTKTLRRILRKVVKDASGNPDFHTADRIYNELETKYDHNEALLKRESQKLKEVFFDLKLNHVEDTYAHMLGELRHNPDTTLTEDVVKEYYNKHKSKINTQKVNKAIVEARKTFDDLIVRVNAVLKEQGMKEIPYRKGYFPHFTQPNQGFLGKLLNWKTIDTEVPTSIAGLTEAFKPQRSWQSFNKQRMGDTTDYSLYQGLDTYIHGALDWIYHVEDLQKRRALENHIRYTHSDEGVKARIQEIKAGDYDADEAQAMIEAVLQEADNPLSGLVRELMNRTNTLANKKSSMDRGLEDATNRKIYSTMTNLNNRINANMVVGSFSAALTNFIPIVQSWHQVSPYYSVMGIKDFVRSTIVDDGMVTKSDFLTNRLVEEENLYQTGWDKVTDKVAFMMNVIDNITSQTVWRSKYLQNIKEGMSERQAIRDADQFAKNVIAGRSRGNSPTIFDAKNPFVKLFTAFQLEVANQYGYMFEDAVQDSKNKVRLVKGYATAFMGAYLYNALYSSLVGRDAAFDPVGIIEDLLKDLFGGDDDEEEEENLTDALLDFGENVVQQIPFVGGLLGGGRVPISAALPYGGDQTPFESMITDVSEGKWDSFGKELLKPLLYLAMPVGGGQIKKTYEGLKMFDEDLPIAGSYTDSGGLRFPVEDTTGNRVQAALFGQWASENARDYFDNERKPLKDKQIQELIDTEIPIRDYWAYRDGLADHEKLEDKIDYIAGLDLPISTKNILVNNVTDRKNPIDLTDYDDFATYEEFDFASKNPEKYEFLEVNNISYDEYTISDGAKEEFDAVYEWVKNYPDKVTVSKAVTDNVVTYRRYAKDLDAIRADKTSSGKSISGSAKKKKWSYIDSLDIDYGAKLILFKNEYNADDTYNYEIVEYLNGRDDISFDEMNTILKELGFNVTADGTITW